MTNIDDAGREVAEAWMRSDVVIFPTPVNLWWLLRPVEEGRLIDVILTVPSLPPLPWTIRMKSVKLKSLIRGLVHSKRKIFRGAANLHLCTHKLYHCRRRIGAACNR
jgi:hypothetical protein